MTIVKTTAKNNILPLQRRASLGHAPSAATSQMAIGSMELLAPMLRWRTTIITSQRMAVRC